MNKFKAKINKVIFNLPTHFPTHVRFPVIFVHLEIRKSSPVGILFPDIHNYVPWQMMVSGEEIDGHINSSSEYSQNVVYVCNNANENQLLGK